MSAPAYDVVWHGGLRQSLYPTDWPPQRPQVNLTFDVSTDFRVGSTRKRGSGPAIKTCQQCGTRFRLNHRRYRTGQTYCSQRCFHDTRRPRRRTTASCAPVAPAMLPTGCPQE